MIPKVRRGYALVEMLVVMTVLAALLTLCAGLIHQLLKLDASSRSASDVAADVARLARDFRADAHASAPIEPTAKPADHLTLPLGDGRAVSYEVRESDILRTVSTEGKKARRFESYRRPARASVHFEVDPPGPRPFATLVIDRPAGGRDTGLFRDYRVEAELGKDRRIDRRPE